MTIKPKKLTLNVDFADLKEIVVVHDSHVASSDSTRRTVNKAPLRGWYVRKDTADGVATARDLTYFHS